jgi:hypothetical protein
MVKTSIEFEVPVIEAVTVSVAVINWRPTVFSVAEKVPIPFVSNELAGSTAWASVLVKCAVPEYPLATLFAASSAVTVKLKDLRALTLAGAATEK